MTPSRPIPSLALRRPGRARPGTGDPRVLAPFLAEGGMASPILLEPARNLVRLGLGLTRQGLTRRGSLIRGSRIPHSLRPGRPGPGRGREDQECSGPGILGTMGPEGSRRLGQCRQHLASSLPVPRRRASSPTDSSVRGRFRLARVVRPRTVSMSLTVLLPPAAPSPRDRVTAGYPPVPGSPLAGQRGRSTQAITARGQAAPHWPGKTRGTVTGGQVKGRARGRPGPRARPTMTVTGCSRRRRSSRQAA